MSATRPAGPARSRNVRERPATALLFAAFGAVLGAAGCAAAGLADRGDRLVQGQEWDEAIAAYEDAAARAPGDAQVAGKLASARQAAAAHWHVRGRKAEEAADLNAALHAYDKAIGFQPDLMAARTDRGKARRLRRVTERELRRVEALLRDGDCLAARRGFEALYAWKPTFPEVETGRVAALERCFQDAMAVAGVFMALGDPEGAAPFLADAEGFYPNHPEVARLAAQAGGAQAAAAKVAEGHGHVGAGRHAEAAAAYRAALELDGSRGDARRAWAQATALEVGRALKGADADLRAGRWERVLAAIEAAQATAPDDPALRARLDAASADLRKRAAARLYELGVRADGAGLFGAAWVWFRLSGLVGRPFGDADMKARLSLGRVNAAAPYRILVTPAAHETDFEGLAGQVRRDLMAALGQDLAASGAQVTLTPDPDIQPPPDGILRGRISGFEAPPPRLAPTDRKLTWQPPARLSSNPETGPALKAHVEAVAAGDPAAVERSLAALRAAPAVLRAAPPPESVAAPALSATWTATAAAELELYDRGNDRVVTSAFSDVEVRREDLFSPPSPAAEAAGASGNPLDAPTVAALRNELVQALVEDLRKQLSPALSMAGLRFQRLADRVKGDARLHYVVLALVAGTPDAEALRQELERATGYRFGEDTYDPARLPH